MKRILVILLVAACAWLVCYARRKRCIIVVER